MKRRVHVYEECHYYFDFEIPDEALTTHPDDDPEQVFVDLLNDDYEPGIVEIISSGVSWKDYPGGVEFSNDNRWIELEE